MESWNTRERPLFVLAPMADVTDRAYRQMIIRYSRERAAQSRLTALWNEFVSCDGLVHPVGTWNLMRDLQFNSNEGPLVAQLFGGNPEHFEQVAYRCVELGYRYIDINMGCPDKTINNQGAGAWLIKTPEKAQAIIRSVRSGCARAADTLGIASPQVSVKTRIGWNADESDTWIPTLLSCGIDLLTVHARTRRDMSDPPPHWDVMKRIVNIARDYGTRVLANGAMLSLDDAREVIAYTRADGAMIGKGTFGKPWFFDEAYHSLELLQAVPREAKLRAAIEHTELWMSYMGDVGPGCTQRALHYGDTPIEPPVVIRGKSFAIMKKNYREYINHFDGARELRAEIMLLDSPRAVIDRLAREI